MAIVRKPPIPEKGQVPARTHSNPPDDPGRDAAATEAFASLVRSTAAGDYRSATAARKALRQLGWSVAPLTKGGPIG